MSAFLFSQLLVSIAFVFDAASFQLINRRHVCFCLAAGAALIAAHFLVLEQHTAGGLYAIAALRFLISAYSTSKRWMWFFMPLVIVCSALTYENPVNLIGLAATLVGTAGSFSRRDKNMRLLLMVASVLWITHNVLVFSPMASVLETLFLVSNLIGYYRFYIRKSRR